MTKQTAANNNFLKEGKQGIAEYAVTTGLLWFVGEIEVAKKVN